MTPVRPHHGGYPDPDPLDSLGAMPAPTPPYRIRLQGDVYEGTITNAIMHLASEFPGPCQVVIDVGHTRDPDGPTYTLSLPCWVAPDDPAWAPALRRVLAHHRR